MSITLIGDIHGMVHKYLKIARQSTYSIQIGDFGFQAEWELLHKSGLDPAHHKVLRGNHDIGIDSPFSLGDFGEIILDGLSIWFCRGAYSIDKVYRVEGVSWFDYEELSWSECYNAISSYQKCRPDIVITHDCPHQIKRGLINSEPRDRTSLLLGELLDFHPPKRWFFGHHHISWQDTFYGCHFQCLNELEIYSLERLNDE